jgi:hypothetical protein
MAWRRGETVANGAFVIESSSLCLRVSKSKRNSGLHRQKLLIASFVDDIQICIRTSDYRKPRSSTGEQNASKSEFIYALI